MINLKYITHLSMNGITWLEAYPIMGIFFMIVLGFLVLKKNSKSPVNRLFFIITTLLSLWMFGAFMLQRSQTEGLINFWDRFIYAGIVFVPALEYHFSLLLTFKTRLRKAMLFIAYLLAFIFLVLSRTDLFVKGIFHYQWGNHLVAGFWHHFFLVFLFCYVLALLHNFSINLRRTKIKNERQKLIFLILSFSFLNIVGGAGFLPAYRIPVYPVIPLLAPLGFSILVGYAMVVHRLMDVNLVVKRYAVNLISFLFVLFLALGVKKLARYFYSSYDYVTEVFILASSLILFSNVKIYFFRVANKYFFTSLYDSRQVIAEINNKLRSTLDINKIYIIAYEVLSRTFRTDSLAFLALNKGNGSYLIKFNKGFDFDKKRNITLSDSLREIFNGRDKSICLEDVNRLGLGEKIAPVIDRLRDVGVEVILPLNTENAISGLIFIGPQKTGDDYSKEDLDVLNNVSTPIAMAVRNALLHEDALVIAEKLHAQAEKISAILANFIDPIIFIDRYNCLGMINPSAESVLEMRPRDIGKEVDVLAFKNEELKKIICENNVQTFGKSKDDPKDLKEIFVSQGDSQIYYKVLNTEVVSESEEFLGTLKIFYDLTKEKALDKSKSEFISVAAHQLRTPLSAVKWIIESFLNKELGEVTPEQKQYLGMASISNQKLITTVNEFLNVSKIEAGSLIYDFQVCDVADVLAGVRVDVENIAKNKNIKLQFNLEENLPKIMADKRKIFIVIENLISNAINYTPDNGKIVIELKRADKQLVVSVKDNGIGIPKKEMEKIFSKFFRASNAVRVQPDGSGLGLFIIKNIVKIHKGEVFIESEEGVGTKMIVSLPIIEE